MKRCEHCNGIGGTGDDLCPECEGSGASSCSRLEVEVIEHKRRYITIEVSHNEADIICRNMLEYNPTSERIEEAENLIKSANVVKDETMEDSYEVGSVEVLIHDENAHCPSDATDCSLLPCPFCGDLMRINNSNLIVHSAREPDCLLRLHAWDIAQLPMWQRRANGDVSARPREEASTKVGGSES